MSRYVQLNKPKWATVLPTLTAYTPNSTFSFIWCSYIWWNCWWIWCICCWMCCNYSWMLWKSSCICCYFNAIWCNCSWKLCKYCWIHSTTSKSISTTIYRFLLQLHQIQ